MKLSSRKSEGFTAELSLTSMIDVVFLLLIFFIATSNFMGAEKELQSSIRFQQASAARVNTDLEQAVVYVLPDRQGGAEYRVGKQVFSQPADLRQMLAANFRRAPQGVFLYVGRGVDFYWVAAAMRACEQAGLGGVSYVPLQN